MIFGLEWNTAPNKSLRKLSEQTGLSYGSCRTTLKRKLHMHPYKVSVIQQLYPEDYRKRIEYCNWFNDNLNYNILDRTFFTDEAWFHLSGYINSQNYRTWSTDNPHSYVETSLHPIKVGVWIAMSRRRLIGPIFFYDTINAARYREQLLEPFINELHDDELTEGYFQQDGAAAHSARTTLQFLEEFFPNRLVSKGRWPPRSPDLTPLDFYLFGNLKSRVFRNRLHDDQLEAAIINEVRNISVSELQNVFDNMKKRVTLCLENHGMQFEHHL